jgi:hypothetical protein
MSKGEDFEPHVFTDIHSRIAEDPAFWSTIYDVGVYWSSIAITILGVILVAYLIVTSLIFTRKLYIRTGRFYMFFDFRYERDCTEYNRIAEEHPNLSHIAFGILPCVVAVGVVFLGTIILPFVWPILLLSFVPVFFVYSGYTERKKFVFLENLKGENE